MAATPDDKKYFQVECKKLLDKNDPLDRIILEMANRKELDVYFVRTSEPVDVPPESNRYSAKRLFHRGRHST